MQKQFTKSDLKTGMVVTLDNGKEALIFVGVDYSYGGSEDFFVYKINHSVNGWDSLGNLSRIVKVELISHPFEFIELGYEKERRKLVWQKEKTPEYTLKQLIEKVGHEFKIKK